jgi:hypothetical protein
MYPHLGDFALFSRSGGKWLRRTSARTRKQNLAPGEIWQITPPADAKGPYWCFDQGGKRICAGVGAYFTRAGQDMPVTDGVMRLEYNVNNNQLWYNLSAVDGINANLTMTYTGEGCQDRTRACLTDLLACPHNAVFAGGVRSCPALKKWPTSVAEACAQQGGDLHGHSVTEMAGCGWTDAANKEMCHRWYGQNACALGWLRYLQEGKGTECAAYGWAYDEKKWRPGDSFDKGNPPDNNVKPLVVCALNGGCLNVTIWSVV